MADYKALDGKAIKLARQIAKMCTQAGSGHPSSALSLLHITTALMYRVMRYDPKNPWNKGADRLVLSEGHAVPVIYAAYCELGGIVGTSDQPSELRFDDALTLREGDSVLDGHPNPAVGFPFFDAATGSLGQGLSVAAGLACGNRVAGGNAKIYCICGDGESREGQIFEALDFIADHKLTSVYTIFNCNGQGQSDYVSSQQSAETLQGKLEAFGFDVKVIDGHDWEQVIGALSAEAGEKPIAIVANTIKGWGVTELQDRSYHGKVLNAEGLLKALADLDAKAAELGVADGDDAAAAEIPAPQVIEAPGGEEISAGSFEDALTAAGWEGPLAEKKLSTRRAYGAALLAIGADPRIVGIDADVKNSTFSEMFAQKYTDRYFEARIAEQNMISAAAGLAAAGRIPFVSTFAKFMSRAYDQIEMAAISHANIKLCGSHAGISLAADGPSQMSLPDVAFFRSIAHSRRRTDGAPAVRVMLPSDAVSAFKLTELMANVDGMCYMRTHRPDVPFIYDSDEEFTMGGFKHLIDGEDIAIVASGYMVHVARQAIELLEETAGLNAGLIDAYSIPLDTEEILKIGDDCRGQILVVEDNFAGGVGDEICAAAAASDLGVTVRTMYVTDTPKSAKSPEETLEMASLSPRNIADAAQKMFDGSVG
ncbi:MAG: transketolase [Phycisphaerae bacterium]|nr:transketolase [Planctomycetota bacterium]MBL7220508.1 transketolase [Phycisphaerae bacterium]